MSITTHTRCPWCDADNRAESTYCWRCGHEAHVPSNACACSRCQARNKEDSRTPFRISDRVSEVIARRTFGHEVDEVLHLSIFHACLDTYEMGFFDNARKGPPPPGKPDTPVPNMTAPPDLQVIRGGTPAADDDDPEGAA